MTRRVQRFVGAAAVAMALALGGTACSGSQDDSGAVTNLDDVGPRLARLGAEVDALRQEVRLLREQVAAAGVTTTTATQPLR